MNDNKAPGMDGIAAEILKNGGEKMIDLQEQVIQSVWESEVPQDWRDAILVSSYKKGSKLDCSNFRGISLMSIVGKLFSSIILNRLACTIVNEILPESQCSFRASCDTVDMIFSAQQLQAKCKEQNLPLYQCFFDLSKAFDTVNRSTLWKIFLKLGCPEKFVGLIGSLHNGMKAELVSTAHYLRKYLSTMGSNRVTFLHPVIQYLLCHSLSCSLLWKLRRYLHQISDIWQCF